MKRENKYIRLDDVSRIKRQKDPHFGKKRMVEEKIGEGSEKRTKREERQRDKSGDQTDRRKGKHTANIMWTK